MHLKAPIRTYRVHLRNLHSSGKVGAHNDIDVELSEYFSDLNGNLIGCDKCGCITSVACFHLIKRIINYFLCPTKRVFVLKADLFHKAERKKTKNL